MDLLIENARLVSMERGEAGYLPTPPARVGIQTGKIAAISAHPVGSDTPQIEALLSPQHYSQTIDLQGQLLTPGLIDCHTHLIYAGNRANEFEMRLNGVPYQEIAKQGGGILSSVKATRAATEEQLIELALPRLDGLLANGVTSVEVKSGYGLTLKDELKMLRAAKALEQERKVKITTTLLAAHALPPEFEGRADDYIEHICQEIIPIVAEKNLATSVDVFCESIGFNLEQTEKVFATAKQYGLHVKGHTEQLSNLGGTELTARYKGLSADHIEYLDEDGVIALSKSDTVATLLPGAFYFLRETQLPPIELLRKYHVPMAIATDVNPGTSPFSDLTLMMNMACTLFRLTPQEALRGVTQHAAQALGYTNSRGVIKTGFDADFAIWDIEHPADLSYQVGAKRLVGRIVNGEYVSYGGF
ncbi:imidazolonepropionase [Vibrio parahaemolyticus]|uniref:imidazolonepropionase n=1 Tax=Vibrio parahaemolyticus TaxID=670 RepID=UPI00035920C1|nr:imidazolonepropionase [Vibrio parahaemolyticus]AGQ90748.1 imidazolonepropionase [Vibrio parahaemolyticus O1:Kuk str. FDA_R31]EGR1594213.1 imidazolonepropionase [Vibrio parahaemolyticus]EGR1727761.1 imidazolonepropionase [Vibrio parahaemolyticus]EHK0044703.1 imidazolonepropionase [Vibrio parahaemolyticus]EHR6402827.1 imidazolonepropionase [Vibrio parahaemolyticus]